MTQRPLTLQITTQTLVNRYSYVVVWLILLILGLLLFGDSIALLLNKRGIRGGNFIDELLFFAFFPITVFGFLLWRKVYLSPLWLFVLIFSVIGWLSTWFNHWQPLSVIQQEDIAIALLGFLQALKPFLIIIVYQSLFLTRQGGTQLAKRLDWFLWGLTFIMMGYLFLVELGLGRNPMPSVEPIARTARLGLPVLRSFLTHPGKLADMMVVLTLYHFAKLLVSGSRRSWLALILAILGVALSIRLRAIFALPICLLTVFLLIQVRDWKVSKVYVVAGMGLTAILLFATSVFGYLTWDELQERLIFQTSSVRTRLLEGALDITQNSYGFGAGFGRFGSPASATQIYSPLYYEYGIAYLQYATPDNPSYITDQWWSWFLGETGLFGFFTVLLTFLFVIWHLHKVAYRSLDYNLQAIAYTALGTILYGILIGYAGSFMSGPPVGYYIMCLAGLSFAIYRAQQREVITDG